MDRTRPSRFQTAGAGIVKAIQLPEERCDFCGALVPVIALTAYEFTARCPCGSAIQFAWARVNPPPQWSGQSLGQLELFT